RERLLAAAARTFAAAGYANTSMRDLARASDMSLAGMYYYVKGKEDLLFQIQKSCFEKVLAGARSAVEREHGSEARLAAFITHHVTYFATHMAEMKVLAHEAEALSGPMYAEVQRIKREYVDFALALLGALDGRGAAGRTERQIAAYALFGMMNWIYTWYDPAGPVGADQLAESITRLFLNGYSVEVSAR
ncbi:MAG TPA: TetR/AcrR family transcriptional regulator, partial [Gemmatimonadales bacterium]|nr:TetR/AcrR family transcriptional regulator [Gemmatimonadales bacterium]